MSDAICTCGLIKAHKAGLKVVDGVEFCTICGLPLEAPPESSPRGNAVGPQHVSTLESLPGYRIVESFGIVTELQATAGMTATSKGNNALDHALRNLRRTASAMSANAIVGLTGSTFGARGGVTSVMGGDAVGVLLIGTAVRVEPDDGSARQTWSAYRPDET